MTLIYSFSACCCRSTYIIYSERLSSYLDLLSQHKEYLFLDNSKTKIHQLNVGWYTVHQVQATEETPHNRIIKRKSEPARQVGLCLALTFRSHDTVHYYAQHPLYRHTLVKVRSCSSVETDWLHSNRGYFPGRQYHYFLGLL